MKLSLPLFALLMLFGCDAKLGKHFELPKFGMFDKDGDGAITEDEAGQFILDSAVALAKMAGKQDGVHLTTGHVPNQWSLP